MSKLENEIEYLITWARCSPATAVTGAFSYAHIIFVLADPPSWSCLDPGATQCDANVTGGYSDISMYISTEKHVILWTGRESICGGGEVVFNTTHQNHFHSLLVENLWICNDVGSKC